MKSLLILLIATYLLSGFVSTQIGLPASSQVSIRVLVAGMLALPFLSWRRLKGLSLRSLAICFLTAFGGYMLGAWAFSHAIALGGYSIAVFVTALPWLGFVEFALSKRSISRGEMVVFGLSTVGGIVFFAPTLSLERSAGNLGEIVIWSLVAALAGAFAQYARRFHGHGVSSLAIADGVIVSAVIQTSVFIGAIDLDLKASTDAIWLLIGGGCYLLSNRLSNVVFAAVSPTLAAVWMSTEPTIALVVSAFFLGAHPSVWEFIGGGLLLGAAMYKPCDVHIEGPSELEEPNIKEHAAESGLHDSACFRNEECASNQIRETAHR
jgi:drug/metabolite transporter (DMT)-like permease